MAVLKLWNKNDQISIQISHYIKRQVLDDLPLFSKRNTNITAKYKVSLK